MITIPDFHQMLLERHSIRRYTDQPIPAEDVKTIIEAALLSPSSKSVRPWRFVVNDDRETLLALSKCKDHYAASIAGAAFAVTVTADPGSSDCWLEDASIAANQMHLQAAALGIGSCWVQVMGRDGGGRSSEEIVRGILGIPEYMPIICIMTFGYPAETRKPVDPARLQWEKVHIGRWNPEQHDE